MMSHVEKGVKLTTVVKSECLEAFKQGNKRDAERLLPQIRQPATERTGGYILIVNGITIYMPIESSVLHLAAAHSWMDVVIDLITKHKCDANCINSWKYTPLHYASEAGHLEVVRYLINEQHCDPMPKNILGETPLHITCQYGHLNIVQYLINEQHCDPMTNDNQGRTPLHYACQYGHLNIVQYLINEQHCDPMTNDNQGRTPLHYACQYGHLNIVQYLRLINEQHCDPMTKDSQGQTPLHYACQCGRADIVQYLLSTGKVDPLAKDNKGKTPMYYAADRHNYDLLKQFRSFPQFKRDFPVHTYTKLILTGYSGAGKTTTSQLIHRFANQAGLFSALSSGRVTDVECLTAGIIPLHVESKVKEVGNMVIYDFAGQQEYYSSHAAVLERIMRNSAAIFVCSLVSLSQCVEKISESIHYWMSFRVENCLSSQPANKLQPRYEFCVMLCTKLVCKSIVELVERREQK